MKIVVTGGNGKAGQAVVRDLVDAGHDVVNLDVRGEFYAAEHAPLKVADLTDYGQAFEALDGAEAVVHLAAIPSPDHQTPAHTFAVNATSTFNVFAAAARIGLRRVVWASSETTLGLPFDTPPDYAPVDEAHPLRPESAYALSKTTGEHLAQEVNRWSGIPFVGLRLSNVMVPADYEQFAGFQADPHLRKFNLWSYVDESHVASAVRGALTADTDGARAYVIAAADTVMERSSQELMAEVFPGVPVRAGLGEHEALLDSTKAVDELGYDPAFTWR